MLDFCVLVCQGQLLSEQKEYKIIIFKMGNYGMRKNKSYFKEGKREKKKYRLYVG